MLYKEFFDFSRKNKKEKLIVIGNDYNIDVKRLINPVHKIFDYINSVL